jgi:hypothetical protein
MFLQIEMFQGRGRQWLLPACFPEQTDETKQVYCLPFLSYFYKDINTPRLTYDIGRWYCYLGTNYLAKKFFSPFSLISSLEIRRWGRI